MAEDILAETGKRIGESLYGAIEVFRSWGPKSELTRRSYQGLTETKLLGYVDKYGYENVRSWVIKNQLRGRG